MAQNKRFYIFFLLHRDVIRARKFVICFDSSIHFLIVCEQEQPNTAQSAENEVKNFSVFLISLSTRLLRLNLLVALILSNSEIYFPS